MPTKLLIFDCETTGVLYFRHAIHQLSGQIRIDDQLMESFDFKIRPHEQALVEEQALKISGVTMEEVMAYPHRSIQHAAFKALLEKYIDPYNPADKFFLVGYNNSYFDNEFLRNFMTLENDDSWGAWFFQNTLDVMILATQYLMPIRASMSSFKLHRVAKTLNIVVDEGRLHEASYDVELTWAIYLKVRGRTIDDL